MFFFTSAHKTHININPAVTCDHNLTWRSQPKKNNKKNREKKRDGGVGEAWIKPMEP